MQIIEIVHGMESKGVDSMQIIEIVYGMESKALSRKASQGQVADAAGQTAGKVRGGGNRGKYKFYMDWENMKVGLTKAVRSQERERRRLQMQDWGPRNVRREAGGAWVAGGGCTPKIAGGRQGGCLVRHCLPPRTSVTRCSTPRKHERAVCFQRGSGVEELGGHAKWRGRE